MNYFKISLFKDARPVACTSTSTYPLQRRLDLRDISQHHSYQYLWTASPARGNLSVYVFASASCSYLPKEKGRALDEEMDRIEVLQGSMYGNVYIMSAAQLMSACKYLWCRSVL